MNSIFLQKHLFVIGNSEETIVLAGGGRRHLAEFGCVCITSACGESLGWETVGLCSCSVQQHEAPRECIKHGK